jgi:hypothetical protein
VANIADDWGLHKQNLPPSGIPVKPLFKLNSTATESIVYAMLFSYHRDVDFISSWIVLTRFLQKEKSDPVATPLRHSPSST